MKIYSDLEEAQLQSLATASESALRTARVGGLWWNSNLSKVRVSDGTLIRSLLRNDQACVFGNSATAAENIRFHRGGSELFQLLLGNDSTAEGTTSNSIAQIDARLRNWTSGTRPASSPTNVGRPGFNTTTNEIEIDNGTEIINIGAGGGSVVITEITRGENIPAGGAPVYIAERDYITITLDDNDTIPLRISSVNYPATVAPGTYLFDTQKNIDTFVAALQTAVDASGIVGVTITVTFSQSLRKFVFTGNTNFDIMWNTQQTDTIAQTLGYAVSSDSTATTTHTANNEIDDSGTGLTQKAFMYQCHADFLHTSFAYSGFDIEGGNQYTDGSITKGEVVTSAHNDGLSLGDLYVAKAAITFDATNNDIDFNDGSDFSASISAGSYNYPYDSLCADIKTVLDATGSSLTFTVTYNPITDKFSIVGSSAYVLEWASGANTATGAHTKLGWTVADTASATTQTSTNAVQQKGRIVSGTSSDVGLYSRKVGFAVEQDRLFAQLDTRSTYIGILTTPNDWLATPVEKDFTVEGVLVAQHENADGYGVRVFGASAAAGVYYIQRKLGPGSAWLDAATTIATGDAGTGLSEDLTGAYQLFAKVFVDDNDKAALAIPVWNNTDGEWRAYVYYSNDLNTWSKSNGPSTDDAIIVSSTIDLYIKDLYIRNSKCVVLIQGDTNASQCIAISDDSGSGYDTFVRTDLGGTINFYHNKPQFLRVQYFPAEVGINQYRILVMGTSTTNDRAQIAYTKGDGSALATISEANTFAAANEHYILSCDIDKASGGNAVIFIGQNTTSGVIYRCLLGSTYNGGTLTTNNFSSATINPSGATLHDTFNGYSSASQTKLILNQNLRSILVGSQIYNLLCLNAGRELWLAYSVDSGSTYSSIQLHNGSATQLVFESCMFYVTSLNKIVVAYKFSDATADNLTEGQIFAGLINLSTTGVPTLEVAFEKIDGAAVGTVFMGMLTGSVNTTTLNLSWEFFNGSRDIVYSQKFI